jgi:hypothetical protein
VKVFNIETIESFTNPISSSVSENVLAYLEVLLIEVIEEIRLKNPIISEDYKFLLVGDYMTGTTTSNSEIDLFMVFNSPQLELNSIKFSNDKLKQFWLRLKRAYYEMRQQKKSKRRLKREAKKKQKVLETQKEVEIPSNKFSILDLKNLIIKKIIEKVPPTTILTFNKTGFKIIDKENLGITISVTPVIKSEENLRVYDEYKAKFTNYNFKQFEENYEKKYNEVGESLADMIRVFKNLYFNINSYLPSQFFIESLLYNVPNELFEATNSYESLIKILNYLHNASIQNFVFIYDANTKLFKTELIEESISSIYNLIKKTDELI